MINGLYRRHASLQGNMIYYMIKLGIADARVDTLVADLLKYHWPDGGWNCDKKSTAKTSTFTHSSIALRGLINYNQVTQDAEVQRAIEASADLFLKRQLYLSLSSGDVIREDFTMQTYPDYHFYTYQLGLKVMCEGGFVGDPRCQQALDLLESRFISGEGFKIEKKYYHHNPANKQRYSIVRWNDYKLGLANLFLSADVLAVLKHSGRLTK